jgi:hypothetical protein
MSAHHLSQGNAAFPFPLRSTKTLDCGLAFGQFRGFPRRAHFSLLTGVPAMSEIFPLDRTAEAYEHMMSLDDWTKHL